MRFDRLVTLGLVRPWRSGHSRPERRLPILMYHRIAPVHETGVAPYYRVCTSPDRFAAQMQWLADAGWRSVGVSEALHAVGTGSPGSERICAITFDDGFRDFATAAAPVLRHHGFRATVYLPTAFIDRPRARFKSADCLTWDEVRTLHQDGMEFGSHTVNHPQLHDLAWPEVWHELEASKLRIERELGTAVAGFAYPYAFPQADAKFRSTLSLLLREQNYRHAVTTVIGRARPDDDLLALNRLPVNEADDQALLLAKLDGAYDWLAVPQSLSKAARRLLSPAADASPRHSFKAT